MAPSKPQDPDDPKQILKKIEKESAEEKKLKTMEILNREKKAETKQPFYRNMQNRYDEYRHWFIRKLRTSQYQRIGLATIFLLFATYMSWKVQSKYDAMRKKVTRSQSFKQEQIQRENQYITRYLEQNKFQSVPIKEQYEPRNPYRFEEQAVIDTKDYLYQQIAKQYREGIPIDPEIEKLLRDRGMI